MGCRSREVSGEETAASATLSDILLFTTMSIIGFPVDVHVKDGSVYSGIFHTASVDNGYGVVLKKARRIKKGKCDTNVEREGLIETLVISPVDLVQVVAKGIMNMTGNDYAISKANIIDTTKLPQSESCNRMTKGSVKDNVKKLETTQTSIQSETEVKSGLMPAVTNVRNCSDVENVELRTVHFGKDKEASNALHNVRQVRDIISQGNEVGDEGNLSPKEEASGIQSSSYSSHDCFTQPNAAKECQVNANDLEQNIASSNDIASSTINIDTKFPERSTSQDTLCLNTPLDGNPGHSSTSSTTSSTCANQKISSLSTKEFKLNPGAKVFCPSFSNRRSVAPPPAVTAPTNTYMPDNFPLIQAARAKPEVEFNSFNPHLPFKVIPSGNLIPGNRIVDPQLSQMIIGQAGNRTVPARYSGQYQTFQGLHTPYSHPNYQNVMVGRLGGQLVYMQPASQDVNHQGVAAAIPQVPTRPLLMPPHPGHLPKHQGQTFPICVTPQQQPHITPGVQQQPQFGILNHNPLLLPQQPPPPPPFQVFHSIPIPGSNGIFGTKLQ